MTAVNVPQLVYELLVLDCERVGTKRKLFLPKVNLASQPGGKIIQKKNNVNCQVGSKFVGRERIPDPVQ